MPPRANQKQKAKPTTSAAVKKENASRSRSRPKRGGDFQEEAKVGNMGPPVISKRSARNRSRDDSKLDESMKSAGKSKRNSDETTPAALQAQHELEIQQAFGNITEQILNAGTEATAVTNVMKRTLVLLMRKSPALFQKTLMSFIERIITLEIDEVYKKNFHLLLTRLFSEFIQERDRQNGVKLVKSVIRQLLEILDLPKQHLKLKIKTGHMLTLIINATAQKVKQDQAAEGDKEDQSESLQQQLAQDNSQPKKASREFNILDESRADQEMRSKLELIVTEMLSFTTSTTIMQSYGIQIASFISDFKNDNIFRQMMKLFTQSKSVQIREKIVKSFRVPYSAAALAFLGKRMRDVNPNVVELIFRQLAQNGVTISQFPTPEARMLVLTEGFTSSEMKVKEACINFLKPTVIHYVELNNIAGLLKLIEARLAFGNEYFGRVPVFVVLAVLEILDSDVTLANYLHSVVLRKLRVMAKIPLNKKKQTKKISEDEEIDIFDLGIGDQQPAKLDQEMVSSEQQNQDDIENFKESDLGKMEVDEENQGPITFEEILLLRLAFELNKSAKELRSQQFIDRMSEILPEFEDYRKIMFALAKMQEPELPFIDHRNEQIRPYPKGLTGFTRRAIMGEWMKFSLQMDTQDEVIRGNLTSLCFDLIGKIEFSFDDYEHLLRKRTQLLKSDEQGSIIQQVTQACQQNDGKMNEDFEEMIENAYTTKIGDNQDAENDTENPGPVEITIRNFENIGTARTLQEYCKPYSMETLTLDFDDVCQIAVFVARTLLGDRIDEFQRTIMESVSDIKEMIQDDGQQNSSAQNNQGGAGMMFSQLGVNQQQQIETTQGPSFETIREKFMAKIDEKVGAIHTIGADEDDVDIEVINKLFSQVNAYVEIVEETHLKEKLSYKRALILCRSLLKQCRLANVHDQNVINICETLIHPAILNMNDKENCLIAFECVGLICILDKNVFLNYSKIFTEILQEELSPEKDNKREKVIAIKSVVDGLILHGIKEQQLEKFFEIITVDYLTTKDRVLRQVAIEGVCKMLFTPKLCDQNDQNRVEAILAQLIIQFFDQKYTTKNSLVTSILTEFLRNFAPFSEKRCIMLLNALTKVMYTVMREKYGLDYGSLMQDNKKGGKQLKKANKKKKKYDSSSSGDEFEASYLDYNSDDSQFQEQKVSMRQICSSINFVKILSIIPTMLSRNYINRKAMDGFKLRKELSLVFFQRLLLMNKKLFKKTQVVKEVILPVLDSVHLENCDSLSQLRQVAKQWAKGNTLIQTTQKVSKFQDRLNQRIQELEEIQEANEQIDTVPVHQQENEKLGADDVEMNQSENKNPNPTDIKNEDQDDTQDINQSDPDFQITDLSNYWDEHVQDVITDRGKNDDKELLAMQQIWLDFTASEIDSKKKITNSAQKSILKSPSNFGIRMGQDFNSSATPQKMKDIKRVRPKRGNRKQVDSQQSQATGGTAIVVGRARGLQAIAEESFHSAKNSKVRKVRIIEDKKEKIPMRYTKFSRGTVKSSVSEDEDEDSSDDSDEEEEEDSASYSETGQDFTESGKNSNTKSNIPQQKVANLEPEEEKEDSSSMQLHENIVSDNLGQIAKNIAKSFAKTSKRQSNGSNQSKEARQSSQDWQTGKGMNVLKLEELAKIKQRQDMSAEKQKKAKEAADEQIIFGERMSGVVNSQNKKRASVGPKASVKKELIRDFDLSDEKENEGKARTSAIVKKEETSIRMNTRRRQKSQSSAQQKSENSDDDDDVYDFMDGTLTKQIKANQRKAIQAKKQPNAAAATMRLQEVKKEANLNDSKASIQSVSSTTRMRTRQRKVVKQ